MGEPVKIVELARDLIELTASANGPRIDVRFTGARPGEKLYEEMFFSAENAEPTAHPKVLRSTRSARSEDISDMLTNLTSRLLHAREGECFQGLLDDLVEDFRTASSTNTVECHEVV
jgi:hypothetical protein